MEFILKAKLPKNMNTWFVRWEIKVKVKSIKQLERSIEYNNWYILLNVINWDNWNYLSINDYSWKKSYKYLY